MFHLTALSSTPVSSKEYEHAWLVLFLVVVVIALVFAILIWVLINYSKKVAAGEQLRLAAPAICEWRFSPDEWNAYVAESTFIKDAKGAGEIKVTVYDIWIKDESGTRRQSLNAKFRVTACRIDSDGIKIRRRSVHESQKSSASYKMYDFHIPIPTGKEDDAARVVAELEKYMADHSEVVAAVTPPDVLTGLMGEVDF